MLELITFNISHVIINNFQDLKLVFIMLTSLPNIQGKQYGGDEIVLPQMLIYIHLFNKPVLQNSSDNYYCSCYSKIFHFIVYNSDIDNVNVYKRYLLMMMIWGTCHVILFLWMSMLNRDMCNCNYYATNYFKVPRVILIGRVIDRLICKFLYYLLNILQTYYNLQSLLKFYYVPIKTNANVHIIQASNKCEVNFKKEKMITMVIIIVITITKTMVAISN